MIAILIEVLVIVIVFGKATAAEPPAPQCLHPCSKSRIQNYVLEITRDWRGEIKKGGEEEEGNEVGELEKRDSATQTCICFTCEVQIVSLVSLVWGPIDISFLRLCPSYVVMYKMAQKLVNRIVKYTINTLEISLLFIEFTKIVQNESSVFNTQLTKPWYRSTN
jgi:hypothetical protein